MDPPPGIGYHVWFHAGVAQSVEQLIRNEKVEGSIPFTGTRTIRYIFRPGSDPSRCAQRAPSCGASSARALNSPGEVPRSPTT